MHAIKLKALTLCVVITFIALLPSQSNANDDFNVSGFGSLIGGFVLDGDGYWARQPYAAGQYESGFEFQSESRLGIQARYFLTDKTRVTGQLMMRGVKRLQTKV